jgi:hypothetical protein
MLPDRRKMALHEGLQRKAEPKNTLAPTARPGPQICPAWVHLGHLSTLISQQPITLPTPSPLLAQATRPSRTSGWEEMVVRRCQ